MDAYGTSTRSSPVFGGRRPDVDYHCIAITDCVFWCNDLLCMCILCLWQSLPFDYSFAKENKAVALCCEPFCDFFLKHSLNFSRLDGESYDVAVDCPERLKLT